MESRRKILVVDEDREVLKTCENIFGGRDWLVKTVHSAESAVTEMKREDYDLVIGEIAIALPDGELLLNHIRNAAPQLPFIVCSHNGDVEKVVHAMHLGASDFIEKPPSAERVLEVVEQSLKSNGYRDRADSDCENFHGIIGRSAAMRRVFDLIERVARSDANVVIVGESGTGKEIVARTIHCCSARAEKAFVPVNCGAFPENLFESELFGYEKGAFTGAYRRKHGLIEFADAGTFFLDEICELSMPLQVKLLRMLQEKNIRRVGGNELIDVDVRVISASNRDIQVAVNDRQLRGDLYYRLNVISIELPSLRDRIDDIEPLSNHFISKYARSTPKTIRGISEEALRALQQYSWPGNVRELENVIERAITLAMHEWIELSDLPASVIDANSDEPTLLQLPLKEAKERIISDFERKYLREMLSLHQGNVSEAARRSGVDRRTFHRMLRRYEIEAQNWRSR